MMNEECSVDVLKLEHYAPEEFEECICQRQYGTSVLYLIFLRALDFYFMGMIISDIILNLMGLREKAYIFFDFWVLILTMPLGGFYGTDRRYRVHKDYHEYYEYPDYMTWYNKLYWALYSLALPLNLLSPIVYWTQVYKNNSALYGIVLNTASPFLMICHFLTVAFPLRLLHFFYWVIFYIVYILFTVIYQKCGGTGAGGSIPIYRVLDWRWPLKALWAALVGLMIGLGLYLLFCFISMGKLWLRDRYLYSQYR